MQVREAELGVWSPDNQHKLAYVCSWRSVVPNKLPDSLYMCAASSEYVFLARS